MFSRATGSLKSFALDYKRSWKYGNWFALPLRFDYKAHEDTFVLLASVLPRSRSVEAQIAQKIASGHNIIMKKTIWVSVLLLISLSAILVFYYIISQNSSPHLRNIDFNERSESYKYFEGKNYLSQIANWPTRPLISTWMVMDANDDRIYPGIPAVKAKYYVAPNKEVIVTNIPCRDLDDTSFIVLGAYGSYSGPMLWKSLIGKAEVSSKASIVGLSGNDLNVEFQGEPLKIPIGKEFVWDEKDEENYTDHYGITNFGSAKIQCYPDYGPEYPW
ncbi:MAG: hypothetical protein HYV68_01890 [Candidatus Taylorbacteria bacterium]|nr:hypothetical protein [Candidatus Taylorbacteria bacterium]